MIVQFNTMIRQGAHSTAKIGCDTNTGNETRQHMKEELVALLQQEAAMAGNMSHCCRFCDSFKV